MNLHLDIPVIDEVIIQFQKKGTEINIKHLNLEEVYTDEIGQTLR